MQEAMCAAQQLYRNVAKTAADHNSLAAVTISSKVPAQYTPLLKATTSTAAASLLLAQGDNTSMLVALQLQEAMPAPATTAAATVVGCSCSWDLLLSLALAQYCHLPCSSIRTDGEQSCMQSMLYWQGESSCSM